MTIRWSPLALERVEEAARFIARDEVESAARWVGELFDRVARLEDHPALGRHVPELDRGDLRQILHGNYRIIYRNVEGIIYVLTVRHGRRDLDVSELD